MLNVQGLHCHLGGKLLLNNINFSAVPGEFVAILGANGVGKSTLFDCLLGQRAIERGGISIDKQPLASLSPRQLARTVALVPQQQDTAFAFSGLDMVLMGVTPYLGAFASPNRSHRQQALAVMVELGIEHLADRQYNQLSGGERQLLLLARALVQSQQLLLLDEPTNHLDYRNRYRMLHLVKQACKQKRTCVVAILHDPNLAQLFADRVLMLDHGHPLAFGTTTEVMTPYNLSRLYGLTTASAAIAHQEVFMPQHLISTESPQLLIVTGESGSGKTTLLQRLVADNANGTLDLNGILCPGEMRDGLRVSSDIVDVRTRARTRFGQRQQQFDPATNTRFTFSEAGLKLGLDALTPRTSTQQGIWLVDEIGPMELKNGGFAKAIAALLSDPKRKHIWVVRPSLIQQAIDYWQLGSPQVVESDAADAYATIEAFCHQ
ncbi:ATP-binding cassette domain-containing protein [Ferrimonas sp. SCSIO 43195]|uniref:ATP-binding cassette domain-containing protein n=1 Tax=Ferrimonas sp. SCSIO 43195 TaxID=2822844 RepID=UPI002075BC6F|nr:ATP-binding cassette domain-containing protein [Ferrimonas sp. SCSIO 43195]USD39468.1 ATP-binding cassette domain-containing protein [Ferrimonas sp. SCSIO 43195]